MLIDDGVLDFRMLVAAIRDVHDQLSSQAGRAVNVCLTLRNWLIGCYIAEFQLRGADRAAYGERLLSELATVLQRQRVSGAGRRQLYGYLAFYRAYPQIVRSVPAQSRHLVPLAVTDGRLCKRCLHKSLGITIWRCWRNDQTNPCDSGFNRRRKQRSGRIHSLEPGGLGYGG